MEHLLTKFRSLTSSNADFPPRGTFQSGTSKCQGISQIGVWDKSSRFEELNRDFLTHHGPPYGASFAQVSLFN